MSSEQPVLAAGQSPDPLLYSGPGQTLVEALGLAHYPFVLGILGLVVSLLVAWATVPITRRYLLKWLTGLVAHRSSGWIKRMVEHEVLSRALWAVPLLVFYQGLLLTPALPTDLVLLLQRITLALLVVVGVRVIAGSLGAIDAIYHGLPMARNRPISSYLQVVNIIAHGFGVILVIATLIGQSPWLLVSGIGAVMAIILLVFRDTLLSLVAGIQLTNNDLIHIGDWIEMPQFGADGDVIDISLHSIRVQNWDRTISVIPTHKFLDNSFRNWRGMQESGGRRIKRSVNIDMSSIRFLDAAEIERFRQFVLLRDYMQQKQVELEEYNRSHGFDPDFVPNARRLTNIGTLRAYIVNYLRQHPRVRQDMTLLVRQLQPTAAGLPLEIYVFSNDTAWANYESIQSDIFDHVLAIIPEFGLRAYQQPSGMDIRALAASAQFAPGSELPDRGAIPDLVKRSSTADSRS